MNEKRLKEVTDVAKSYMMATYGSKIDTSSMCSQSTIDKFNSFIEGVKWADEHPLSKYNLSDSDYIKMMLEDIVRNAERLTSGNVVHNGNSIRLMATMALKKFEKNEN